MTHHSIRIYRCKSFTNKQLRQFHLFLFFVFYWIHFSCSAVWIGGMQQTPFASAAYYANDMRKKGKKTDHPKKQPGHIQETIAKRNDERSVQFQSRCIIHSHLTVERYTSTECRMMMKLDEKGSRCLHKESLNRVKDMRWAYLHHFLRVWWRRVQPRTIDLRRFFFLGKLIAKQFLRLAINFSACLCRRHDFFFLSFHFLKQDMTHDGGEWPMKKKRFTRRFHFLTPKPLGR